MPRVLNKRTDPISSGAVFIGRPSKWGNPYKMSKTATRENVVKAYEVYLLSNAELMNSLHELRGRDLVCFCAPEPCHGDVLLKYANRTQCPYCHGTMLTYAIYAVHSESGEWCDTIEGHQYRSLDDVIANANVLCNECGFTFNPNEEG